MVCLKIISLEQNDGCQMEEGLENQVKKVKGLGNIIQIGIIVTK